MGPSAGCAIAKRWVFAGLLLAGLIAGGCKKSTEGGSSEAAEAVIAFPGGALNPDGTLPDATLQKIQSHSTDAKLTVSFVRSDLTDSGLAQLATFPNIRHVEAIGSRISNQGIDKLKQAIPEVQVSR